MNIGCKIVYFYQEEGWEMNILNNKYLLATMVAKRTKQLRSGAKPLVESKNKKFIIVALEEIMEGKVFIKEKKEPLKGEEIFNEDKELIKPEDISNEVKEPEKAEEIFNENEGSGKSKG